MSDATLKAYFQGRLVPKLPHALLDARLRPATVTFLQTVGLPNEATLRFSFDEHLRALPNGLIQLHGPGEVRPLFLDPHQEDALFSASNRAENSFVNSSARQFAQCLWAFEQFITTVYAPQKLGPVYDEVEGHRQAYAAALETQFLALDPAVAERGYYWPAFVEDIANGLL